MSLIRAIPVPPDSLLAAFGGSESYRDCFTRDMPETLTLRQLIERFYSSTPFLPERLVLKMLGKPAARTDARRLAQGETDSFGVWQVVARRENEILLDSKPTGTASWLAVEPFERGTRLYFGTWVGNIDRSGWKPMELAHLWYSRMLLGGV